MIAWSSEKESLMRNLIIAILFIIIGLFGTIESVNAQEVNPMLSVSAGFSTGARHGESIQLGGHITVLDFFDFIYTGGIGAGFSMDNGKTGGSGSLERKSWVVYLPVSIRLSDSFSGNDCYLSYFRTWRPETNDWLHAGGLSFGFGRD
jgi:lipoprotein signal peptidase